MRPSAVLALALALASARAVPARAQQAPPPAPAPRPAALPTVSRLADAVAQALASAPPHALVVAAPLVSDTPAPRAAALVVLVAAQLAGRLGRGAHARPEPLPLAAAREAAKGDGALVYVSVELAAGKLRVAADAFPVPHTVWARIRDPEPAPSAHGFGESALDAEVRSYLAPIPLTAASVERGRNFESDVVALACGDVDGDGALEIVSVSRRRVTTLRLRGGRVQPIASRNWPDLAGVSPAPLREPIGFATVVTRPGLPPFVDVGLSDRARSVRLDGKLDAVATFPGLALPDGEASACARIGAFAVTGALTPCAPGDPAPRAATVGGRYDAFASTWLTSTRGERSFVWIGREDGALEARDDAGHKQGVGSSGAQLAVADLDQDGEPELLSSLDVASPLEDAVVVRTWPRGGARAAGAPVEMLRIPAPAGVHALAVCPPDGPGRAPFVVATADEIWVVR